MHAKKQLHMFVSFLVAVSMLLSGPGLMSGMAVQAADEPKIEVVTPDDYINLSGYTPGGDIHLELYDSDDNLLKEDLVTADPSGNVSYYSGFHTDFLYGMEIRTSGQTEAETKSLFIGNVDVSPYSDFDGNIYYGSGDSEINSEVVVHVFCSELIEQTVSVMDGDWSLNLDGQCDISSETYVYVFGEDEDGDRLGAELPSSALIVGELVKNKIYGYGFPANSEVVVDVYANSAVSAERLFNTTVTTTDDGSLPVIDLPFQLSNGNYIQTETTADHTVIKNLEVIFLSITQIDYDTDTVTGAGPAGAEIFSFIDGEDGRVDAPDATAGPDGSYEFDYPDSADLVPGDERNLAVGVFDEEGDATLSYMPSTHWLIADTQTNTFEIMNLAPYPYLKIQIVDGEGEIKHQEEFLSGKNWSPSDDTTFGSDAELEPGDIITVAAGYWDREITRALTIVDIAITNVSFGNDTVNGTAQAGTEVEVEGCNGSTCHVLTVTAGDDGEWSADFKTTGTDLQTTSMINAYSVDEDGDKVHASPAPLPILRVDANQDWVKGERFAAETAVSWSVVRKTSQVASGSVTSDADGKFVLKRADLKINLLPDDRVRAVQGDITKQLIVWDLVIDQWDRVNKEYSGHILPSVDYLYHGGRILNGEETWVATFAPGDDGEISGTYGLSGGDLINEYQEPYARATDADGDVQETGYVVPQVLKAAIDTEKITLSSFAPSTSYVIKISDPSLEAAERVLYSQTHTTDGWGDLTLNYSQHKVNLEEGYLIEVFKSTVLNESLTLTAMAISSIDSDLDLVWVATSADADIEVSAQNGAVFNRLLAKTNDSGEYEAAFIDDGIFYHDLTPDSRITAGILDPDGDQTTTSNTPCYALSTAANPGGAGTFTYAPEPNCNDGKWSAGTQVTVTANPTPGFVFGTWQDPVTEKTNKTIALTLDSDKAITADFATCMSLTMAVSPADTGSIAANPAPNCGAGLYVPGTQVTLTAQPEMNYALAEWGGDGSGSEKQIGISLATNKSVTASFVPAVNLVPGKPVQTAPASGTVFNKETWDEVILRWDEVPSYLSQPNGYLVQVSSTSNFDSLYAERVINPGVVQMAIALMTNKTFYWRVRAKNQLGYFGPWSSTRSYTVDTTPPKAPVLISPKEDSSVDGIPQFSWDGPSDTKYYELQVSSRTDFDMDLDPYGYTSNPLKSEKHTPLIEVPTDFYYWRVRGQDAAGNWGVWSQAIQFETEVPLPAKVSLTSPANGAYTASSAVNFGWKDASYGDTYWLQVASKSDFASSSLKLDQKELDFAGGSSQYTLDISNPTLWPDGKYYWRVKARNIYDKTGEWSSARSFVIDRAAPAVPSLSSPQNNSTVTGIPTLKWGGASGAKDYQLQLLSDDEVFVTSKWSTSTSYKPAALPEGVYTWKVMARDAAGNLSAWSPAFTLTVAPATPARPTLTSPANDFRLNASHSSLTFAWPAVPYASAYRLQISLNSSFKKVVLDQIVSTVSEEVDLTALNASGLPMFPDGKYYWRVTAINSLNKAGKASKARAFTIDRVAPGVPVISKPLANTAVRTVPTFDWGKVSGTYRYVFQVDLFDPDHPETTFADAATIETKSDSYKPAQLGVGTYCWRVATRDVSGNRSDWATTCDIQVYAAVPGKVGLSAPANGYSTTDTTPFFQWKSITFAATYQFELSKSSSYKGTVIRTETSGLSYAQTEALSEGTWYWRVRAINDRDEAGAWSSSRAIKIDLTAPAAVKLSDPHHKDTVTAVPTFSWSSVSGLGGYQFQLATKSDFTAGLVTVSGLTKASYKPYTLAKGTYYWRVRVQDAAGNWSPWSEVYRVTYK